MDVVAGERRRDLWYLVTSGLLSLKLGLVEFLKAHIELCHQEFLENIANSLGLASASEINGSDATWIQKIDVNKRFFCQSHKTGDIEACSLKCPNAARHKLLIEIKNLHRHKYPMWKNTKLIPSQWILDPFEFAKCFLSALGYQHVTSVEELDPSGILSIMINLVPIAKVLNIKESDIKTKTDVLSKVNFISCLTLWLFRRYNYIIFDLLMFNVSFLSSSY